MLERVFAAVLGELHDYGGGLRAADAARHGPGRPGPDAGRS